jgi:hypothetical protein
MNEEKNVRQRRKGKNGRRDLHSGRHNYTEGIATGMLSSFHQSPFTLFPLPVGVSFKFQ